MLFTLFLMACGGADAPTAPTPHALTDQGAPLLPTAIAVSVPLSGPSSAQGRAALQGVKLAVPSGIDVVAIDEELGDPVPHAVDDDRVVGVVAHVTQVGAERWAAGWAATDLAVVMAAPATIPGLPRVLAGAERHVRCATAFLGHGQALVINDGTAESTLVSNAVQRELGSRSLGTRAIDTRLMGNEADRVRTSGASWVVYTGNPADGGNMLRALRRLGGEAKFLGIGLYDPRFLAAVGHASTGAIVTSQDRPALDLDFVARWRSEYHTDVPAVALNAYDAARLIVEAWSSAAVPSRDLLRVSVKDQLRHVQIDSASGPIHLDTDGVAEPAWCTGFEVKDDQLVVYGVARVVAGQVELVDLDAERAARWAAAEAAEAAEAEAGAAEAEVGAGDR